LRGPSPVCGAEPQLDSQYGLTLLWHLRKLTCFIRDLNERLCESAAFAYVTILLLQLKILSGFIRYPELSTGDTSSYFTMAYDWHHTGRTLLSWSPLYTSFYGAFLNLSDDAFVVTAAHRLVIVIILAALVLAFMRRLLPAGIAWLMTAWWVVMPINFNSLYEVHLFAVILVLSALLLSLTNTPWGAGGALGVLLASSLLMRNELFICFTVLAGAVMIGEIRKRSVTSQALAASRFQVAPFLVPLLLALALFGFFSSRAKDWPILGAMLDRKHTLNICQVYAFGYQQRHSDFSASPWTECQQLMLRVYGEPEPSLARALRKNPGAMIEHFIWNVRLIPNGLQLLLFNATSGSVNPDYIDIITRSRLALWASLALTILIVWGGMLMIKQRHRWRENLLDRHPWFWITASGLAFTSVWVMVMQRPRPSYLLAFGILIRAIVGILLMAIARRSRILQYMRWAYPAFAILLMLRIPPYYPGNSAGRALLEAYRRLYPFEQLFRAPGVKLLGAGWSPELCNYLGGSAASCQPIDYLQIHKAVSLGSPFPNALANIGVNVFYADLNALRDPPAHEFIRHPPRANWVSIERQDRADQSWMLLAEKSRAEALISQSGFDDIIEDRDEITLGRGWHDLERNSGVTFRWASSGAEIILSSPPAGLVTLTLDIAPGPGVYGKPFFLQVLDRTGKRVAGASVRDRSVLRFQLPVEAGNETIFRLCVDGGGHLAPNDRRIMDFRLMKIGREP